VTAKKTKLPQVKVYQALETTIGRGLRFGWRHAHKYVDCPSEEEILERQLQDIMLELNEDFEL